MSKTIGLIGVGRFSTILSKYLHQLWPQHQLIISSNRSDPQLPENTELQDFETVCQADFIIPCVPINTFEAVIQEVAKHIGKNSTMVSISSLMKHPADMMLTYLPKDTPILATHPMWGPQSAKDSIKDLTTIVYPLRNTKDLIPEIRMKAEAAGNIIKIMTPEDHDTYAAQCLFLTQVIANLNKPLDLHATPIDNLGYKHLLEIQRISGGDSIELLKDLYTYNPYAKEVFNTLTTSFTNIKNLFTN